MLYDKDYVALAYMTGILPIKKYGSHSALNMFAEYSMTNPREMTEFFGFTEKEVYELCKQYKRNFDMMATDLPERKNVCYKFILCTTQNL